jgi:gliding motility-associated lipoprotein GldD
LPQKVYKLYDPEECPFSFEIPVYSHIEPYRDSVAQPCWKYLLFDQFNGQLFLSYVNASGKLNDYLEESRKLVYKHTVKADAINETFIESKGNVSGIIYDIGGNAASPVQFFVTDSTRHFLRGALYFNTSPQPDSLAPVIDFLRKDIVRMITTLKWK